MTTRTSALSVVEAEPARQVPGLVVIFADQRPALRILQVDGEPIELGRLQFSEEDRRESMISRRHARVACGGTGFRVSDLGSRNGTFVAGRRISAETELAIGSTLRIGGVLLLAVADTVPFREHGLGVRDGIVSGPFLRQVLETVTLTRRMDLVTSLLLSGESGTGKEIAAQAFHRAGPNREAPFVAVNCATIPKDLAERLLFGSRRGAFSGATDAPGHVQAAHGGTLFLDEIAELPPEVQTKLLRMLETRQVQRLGATNYESVDLRVCAATWRDLRGEVAAGRFREDLYFRIGQPELQLPPLRQRIDELPWHIQHVLDAVLGQRQLSLTATFVEACASRVWPGNVRELRAEVRRVAAVALARGAPSLGASDLAPRAGEPIERAAEGIERAAVESPPSALPEDEFAAALAAERGNVVGAARRLGVHRNQVRRWLERHEVDPRRFKD